MKITKSKVEQESVKKMDFGKMSINAHKKFGGKLELVSKFKLKNKVDLSIAYTPGVAEVCLEIAKDVKNAKVLSLKKNTIAVVSDGSAVLGLGNIGAYGAIPVMEGKAVLMKHFAGVDAFPICVQTQDTEEIINFVRNLEPVFGGINLEDIAAPKCFEIEERLIKELGIPVMHDDQWGAGVVAVAGFINSLKVVNKKKQEVNVAVVGAGAAGIATIRLLNEYGVKNIVTFDTKGAINIGRTDLSKEKFEIAKYNIKNLDGSLKDLIQHFDVFIGLSKPNVLTVEDVENMRLDPIIFALANPSPEIMPELAKKGGAKVIATGRSDYPNQINNSLFFPGFWRGMLDRKSKDYNTKMLIKCAEVIAGLVPKPTSEKILPSTLDKKVHEEVAKVVRNYK